MHDVARATYELDQRAPKSTALEQRLDLKAAQRQLPVPLLAQVMRLVPCTASDVQAEVDRALESNPFLTRTLGFACPACGRHLRGRRCPTCAVLRGSARVEAAATHEDWRTTLVNAVCLEPDSPSRAVVEQVVNHLDNRGLLVDDAATIGEHVGVPAADVIGVIEHLRTVGPPGLAARSPIECVRLQCAALVANRETPAFLLEIVDHHLDELADGQLDNLAVAVGQPPAEVERVVDILRRRTRPFVSLDTGPDLFVRPDIVIRRHSQVPTRLVVEVADARWFGLAAIEPPDDGANWARPFVREATTLIKEIDLRASLLRRLGEALIVSQRDFLLIGASMHRPLRRTTLASLLGVHPSTVGRAVRDKWLQCPDGRVIPLSACFGASTGPIEVLRGALTEHPDASDARLVGLLADRGVRLARRTVTKYRARLGVSARHPKPGSRHAG
jgi:RNA polymerase sigma-54 factor